MAHLEAKYLHRLRDGIIELDNGTSAIFEKYGGMPLPNSLAHKEHETFVRPESVITGITISTLLLEYSSEHLSAFVKNLSGPIEPLASASCVRSMLEACSIVAWLADPRIDSHTRIGRVLAHRYEGAVQRLKWARSLPASPDQLIKIQQGIDSIENDAMAVGYLPLRNDKDKRLGIGQIMPSATDLIKCSLGEETMYRALSAVAHGHHWAITELGFQRVATAPVSWGSTAVHLFEKTIDLDRLAPIGWCASSAFAKAIWHFGSYIGWETSVIASTLEKAFDIMQLNDAQRFWRYLSIESV